MEWTIDYLDKDKIARVKTRGLITWDDTRKMSQEVLPFIHHNNLHKVLVDHRDMVPNLSVLQIDDLPAMFKKIGIGPEYKTAVMFNPASQNKDNFAFLDNVKRLASLRFRSFTDENEAISWHKSGDNNSKRKV